MPKNNVEENNKNASEINVKVEKGEDILRGSGRQGIPRSGMRKKPRKKERINSKLIVHVKKRW